MKWKETDLLPEKGFVSGEDIKKAKGVKIQGNRFSRRKRIRMSLNETLRQAKRVDRIMYLRSIAEQIREWYPEDFKENYVWKWIEVDMKKLLGRKGESNIIPKKKKR